MNLIGELSAVLLVSFDRGIATIYLAPPLRPGLGGYRCLQTINARPPYANPYENFLFVAYMSSVME